MKSVKSVFMSLLLLSISATTFAAFAEDALGTRENPIKIFFTPSVDANTIATNSVHFLKFMEKETGLYFKSGIPSNFIAVVEAFGSNRADVAVMNSFGYLLANSKFGAEAKLKTFRHGKDYYSGAIYVSEKSGIKDIKGLAGKKFAFTDASSTSGYLYPLKIFKEAKVKLGNTMFAGKHDNVITMIYQGQVDAGAAFYSDAFDGKIKDARERVMTQFPDVESKVKVLKITDKIPNDPFVFRKGIAPAITQKIVEALKKYISTEEGKTTFKNIYAIDGIVPASNKDYDSLRAVIKALDLDLGTLVK
ncbi:MAG: phosphate/phosphite/phosphonate ABC transporter substrate-binding protein [Bacteriovorax sp.]|nr:phosphate/phosphite/phosphonate ABC transporter substrate-binding protein [Bacteriovorax sp.]